MKKFILVVSLNIFVLSSFGQKNPVTNLHYNWQYISPLNCFTLSWDAPVPSVTDTLIGYTIYRNDSLYTFILAPNHMISCNPCIGDTSTIYFSFMSYISPFYAHVKAVYNTSHIESVYNDSTFWNGMLATDMRENRKESKLQITPNPFNTATTLHLDKAYNNITLTLYNSQGQQVKQVRNISEQTITLQRSNLKSGSYFVQLRQDNKIITTNKLLVTDN